MATKMGTNKVELPPAGFIPSNRKVVYRGVNKGLYVLLSRTQAGPCRTV